MNQPGPAKRSAEDTLAIQAVVVLYGFLVDDREWDLWRQLCDHDHRGMERAGGSNRYPATGTQLGRHGELHAGVG